MSDDGDTDNVHHVLMPFPRSNTPPHALRKTQDVAARRRRPSTPTSTAMSPPPRVVVSPVRAGRRRPPVPSSWLTRLPRRYRIVAWCASSVVISYADRSNLAIALIPMSDELGFRPSTRGLILSSFFYGYMATQILGGWWSDRYGGKPVLAMGALLWSLFTGLTPMAARAHLPSLLLCRVLLGAGEGVAFPAIHAMLARWIPPAERSKAVAWVTTCSYVGAVLAMLVSSPLAAMPVDPADPLPGDDASANPADGLTRSGTRTQWPWIFYVFSAMGMAWLVGWLFDGASRPDDVAAEMTRDELAVLQPSLLKHPSSALLDDPSGAEAIPLQAGGTTSDTRQMPASFDHTLTRAKPQRRKDVPWKRFFTTPEIWAIMINHFCGSWGFYVLLNWLPTYYKDTYHIDLKSLGYFSVLPYLVQGGVGMVVGGITQRIKETYGLRTSQIRRLAQTIGMLGPAFFLVLGTRASTIEGGVAAVTMAFATNAVTLVGVSVSHLDVAPAYAGIIFGIGNTVATLPGIIGVQLTGLILDHAGDAAWTIIFSLAAFVYIIGWASWMKFGGGDHVVIE